MTTLTGLIAEIGNHHLGDIAKARELIRAAKQSGATFVKMQAIDPEEFQGGSMPRDFYRVCDLGLEGYLECEEYAYDLDIPLFFSVFGSKYLALACKWPGKPYKISGSQFLAFDYADLAEWNGQPRHPIVVSIPEVADDILAEKAGSITNMNVMYVTGYLKAPSFATLEKYASVLAAPVGYSDHNAGIGFARVAIMDFGCRLVEKHFNIYGTQSYEGFIYRDSMHAADQEQLERLAKAF